MKKTICLNGSMQRPLAPSTEGVAKLQSQRLKKKKKRVIILRFMIHKMFWIHMYLSVF